MYNPALVGLRHSLATKGKELTITAVGTILDALADIADVLDGSALLDIDDDLAIYVEDIGDNSYLVQVWDYSSPSVEEMN